MCYNGIFIFFLPTSDIIYRNSQQNKLILVIRKTQPQLPREISDIKVKVSSWEVVKLLSRLKLFSAADLIENWTLK